MAHVPLPVQTPSHEYQLALGARLVAAFEQESIAQDTLRRVLCLGTIPKGLPATMLEWMRNFQGLRALHEELAWCLLSQSTITPVAVALGPLLAWASNQDWSDSIEWSELLSETCQTLGRSTPINGVAAMDYTLRVMQPCFPVLHPERRSVVLNAWLQSSALWQCHRWSPKEVYPLMATAWVQLGLLAEMTPYTPNKPAPLQCWKARAKETLYAVMTWEQAAIIDVLLDSPLSNTTKVLAACAGDPESVEDPSIANRLRSCLPIDESRRVDLLPWASPVGSLHKSGSPRTYMVHEAIDVNTRMIRTFCPELHRVLDCLVTPKDWAEKHKILAYVQAFRDPFAQDSFAQDSFALPMDLETTSEVA